MKGNPKPRDRLTRGIVFVLYVTLYLTTITCVSMIQINVNTTAAFTLYIEYEEHTVTGTGYSFDHSYNTIIVNLPIVVHDYESTLSSYLVGNYPLWIDVSDWNSGDDVNIAGNLYVVSSEGAEWKAHRSLGDEYSSEILFYNKLSGIFMESHTDQMTLGSSGFGGSDVDIEIQQSNINEFLARYTGSNVVSYILLISGIFTEILIIHGLWERRKKSSSPKQASG
ncbi:MAG: hypothetical protein ACFFBL_05915 [Promethearchaeota archaeon]